VTSVRAQRWTRTTLGATCEVNPAKPNLTEVPDSTSVLFVPMAAVDEATGTVANPQERPLGEVRSKSYRSFAPEDVLFAKITPCMENGKSAVVPAIPSGIGFGSTEFHVLRPKDGLNPGFLWHFVRQRSFRRTAEEHMTGSVGQARVPAGFLRSFPIAIPSPATQKRIGDLLDAMYDHTLSARDHIAAARRAIARFRRAVLSAACLGHLTKDWREEHPDLSAAGLMRRLTQERARSVEPRMRTPSAIACQDLPPIPESWVWSSVDSISLRVVDGVHRTPTYTDTGIPFVTVKNLTAKRELTLDGAKLISEEDHMQFCARANPERGDLLISKDGTLGVTRAIRTDQPFSIFVSVALIKPVLKAMTDYLEIALSSSPVQAQMIGVGSGLQHLVLRDLKADGIPIPPLDEQAVIVSRVSSLLDAADRLDMAADRADRRVTVNQDAVAAKAFRGDLPI
jgi:type I restriction enzyme, S subunit